MLRLNSILEEPWRCECPYCESYMVVRLFGGKRKHNKTYKAQESQEASKDRACNWRCYSCNEWLREVYDKKQQEIVKIKSLVKYDGSTVKALRAN